MNLPVHVLDIVALTEDLPERGLRRGRRRDADHKCGAQRQPRQERQSDFHVSPHYYCRAGDLPNPALS